jgi:formylglycine-generating enzyme required for sulfatase activity
MSLENKRHPMTGVSWDDTQKYITWLNEKTGKTYRLPTEEEWFSACQAGKTTKYCGGENIDLVAWHYGNSGATTHEVGQKAKNEWGLYDMSGNVGEWTNSSYIAINSKMIRVVRGWSWVDVDESSVMRFGTPDNRFYHIGFRLARL